jgi:hypothetical protein
MESKSVFISSCSRRQLARRRPNRSVVSAPALFCALLLLAALVALAAVQGWL